MKHSIWKSWVWFVCVLHWSWSVILFYSETPQEIPSIYVIYRIVGYPADAMILFIVASLAAFVLLKETKHTSWGFAMIMLQQLVLMLGACGSFDVIWNGRFIGGLERSRWFIAANQLPAIIATVFHTIAIVDFYLLSWLRKAADGKANK